MVNPQPPKNKAAMTTSLSKDAPPDEVIEAVSVFFFLFLILVGYFKSWSLSYGIVQVIITVLGVRWLRLYATSRSKPLASGCDGVVLAVYTLGSIALTLVWPLVLASIVVWWFSNDFCLPLVDSLFQYAVDETGMAGHSLRE